MRNLFIAVVIFLTLTECDQPATKKNNYYSNSNMIQFTKGRKMDKQEFWKIIDYSFAHSNGSQKVQEEIILDKLLSYSLEEIKDFEMVFRQLIIEADDYKIVAADKIIEGWVTDDSYLYFRCWLIGQGQNTFEEALKDPDYLANRISEGDNVNFEELMHVTTTAYSQKTGKEEDETFPRDVAVSKGLDYDVEAPPTKGIDWTEDQLPKLYPKLWANFN